MGSRHTLTLVAVAALASVPLGSTRSRAQTTPTRASELPGTILVQVTDTSRNPLRAEVRLPGVGVGVWLPPEGVALFVDVPDGLYVVEAHLDGYASQSRTLRVTGDTVRIDFVLSPGVDEPARRDPLRAGDIAQARLRYFMERGLTMGSGAFITRNSIERLGAYRVSGALREIPDVRIERARQRTIIRSKQATGPGCADGMLLFVDGTPLPRSGASSSGASSSDAAAEWGASAPRAQPPDWQPSGGQARDVALPTLRWVGPSGGDLVKVAPTQAVGSQTAAVRPPRVTDIDRVRVSSVLAIEVYSSPGSAPPELRMPGTECGVVMVWTTGK